MRIAKQLRWAFWAGLCGIALAAVLVVLYRFTQSPLIIGTLLSVDQLGLLIASWAPRVVFPGDRISYPIISAPVFFDVVLVLATGLQTALIGVCISFIPSRRSSQAN